MTNVGSCLDEMQTKNRLVEIVDIVFLKFASDEVAGWSFFFFFFL